LVGGPPRWRLRFGSYRAIYAISDRDRIVFVIKIAKRGDDTYD
jgi:mRNA-degrading endonuclease RelE of RelBE toxin-antitoxin system